MGFSKPEVTNLVKDFLKRVKRDLGVQKAIVFGSVVRGETKEDSDIDIILVGRGFRGMAIWNRMVRARRLWTYSVPVDILCYTPEEFDKLSKEATLVKEAVMEGFEVRI